MDIGEIIRAVQRELHVTADGAAGPQTWTAIYEAIVGKRRKPPAFNAVVDDRSERAIATLLPELVPYARALVHGADDLDISIRVISGTRTFAEQDALFAQGRTKPGRIVTHARGGFSNHNFGIAFDVGVFEGSRYLGESPKYAAVGALGMDLGLEWGGNWRTLVDQPHFQLRPEWADDISESAMLAELRRRREANAPVFA